MRTSFDALPACTPVSDALLTDLYELTMVKGYVDNGMLGEAVFEFFVRDLPPWRSFLVCAGLEQLLFFLEGFRYSRGEVESLAQTSGFPPRFLAFLRELRFAGDVDAMPEGTIAFPNEPLVRVVASMPEAQIVESRLINLVHLQTLIASKAARCVLAAPGKLLIDFGLRRAHGFEAGHLAARAAYLAGFDGTSTVSAAIRFRLPLFGTMAHSFVEAHEDEREAFLRYARANPDRTVLLIDTYDTERGARNVVNVARGLAKEGVRIDGVRLDSGDLAMHARRVRGILDHGGLAGCKIFASGGLDEWILRDLIAAGAPIDGFGVGTSLDTSSDAPFLDCAYKLQEYGGQPRRKQSEGKETWPGRKQVYRTYGPDGAMAGDTVTLLGDEQAGDALLRPVMRGGRILGEAEPLEAARRRFEKQLDALPQSLRTLETARAYPVRIARPVRALAEKVDARRAGRSLRGRSLT